MNNLESIKATQNECLKLLEIFKAICDENDITYWIDGGTLLGSVRHNGFIPWDDDIDICVPISEYHKLLDLLSNAADQNETLLVYFNQNNFINWCDFFSTTRFLIDEVFPVKIDVIPFKLVENDAEKIRIDKSLTEIATYFIMGHFKFQDNLLEEHRVFYDSKLPAIKLKTKFFKFYENYLIEEYNRLRENPENHLLCYIFNDAYVSHARDYYRYSDVFPLTTQSFENKVFKAPRSVKNYLLVLYGKDYMELPPLEKRTTHQRYLTENKTQPKKKVNTLLMELYSIGFANLRLGKSKNKILKIFSALRLTLPLLFKYLIRGEFVLFKRIVKYSYFQLIKN